MSYRWNSNLETGYALIDNQHKQLIEALNRLLEAGENGPEEVIRTLEFLSGYTHKHFADEEALQTESDYPDYLNHRRCHNDFRTVVAGYIGEVREKGASQELVKMVAESIVDWLLNHIQGDDFRLAAYIQARES